MSFTFPKGLSFAFDKMAGFSKQIDIVYPDRKDSVSDGSTIRVRFNANSLINLRTVSMYYKFTTYKVGDTQANAHIQGRYHPRLSSSIIENIGVYMNNYLVDQVNDYNLLYNTMFDLTAGADQDAKSQLQAYDPSVKYLHTLDANGTNAITARNICLTNNTTNYTDTARRFVINNFCNFFGTSSCEVIDTNDVGDFEIVIKLAPSGIVFKGSVGEGAAAANLTAASYLLDDIYFTYERIIFNDPLFDELKRAKIMSEKGLEYKWTSVSTHNGPLQADRNINYSFNTSAQSLDTVICTTRRTDYPTVNYLQLDGSTATADVSNFKAKLAAAATGDLFNQSIYFRRDMLGLTSSQISINGTRMYKKPLTAEEIFNEDIVALNGQADLAHSIHPGCNSIYAFLKYYFAHILSLNYNGETGVPLISGLDSKGSTFNIEWTTTAATVNSPVYPVVFCLKSSVVAIHPGKQVVLL